MQANPSILLTLGLLLLSGLLLGRLAARLGLPRVVAYVLAGALFSPGLLGGPLGIAVNAWSEPLTNAALGIIAYIIGGSVTGGQLRRSGKVIIGTALGESLGAVVLVFLAMLLVLPPSLEGLDGLEMALAFGAIAVPTAPAATLAVLHQYHARGPLSTTLLGVVVLDDALGILLFSLMLVVTTAASFSGGVADALYQILSALALGLLAGRLLGRLAQLFHQAALQLPLVLGTVLLVLGISETLGSSALLAAMVLGFSARSALGAAGERLIAPVEYLEELVFLVFFTLAGAMFQPALLSSHMELVMVYFLARVLGKIAGAHLGARLGGAQPVVARWLGLGLVPQAGVAVGLALTLSHLPGYGEFSALFLNVVLGSTLLYEISGPFAVRFALNRAGELGSKRLRRNGP